MTVTKRGLVKVIVLLVIIDLIAAFWYISLRIENSGESHDLWEKTDSLAEAADTIAEITIPDTFDIVEAHGYFISQQPMIAGKEKSHLASIKTAKLRFPISINGNDSIGQLQQALLEKAFGNSSGSVKEALKAYTSIPAFANNAAPEYKEVKYVPTVDEKHCNNVRVLIYPLYTSHRLMVFEVDHKRKENGNKFKASSYVHYDRVNQQIIKRSDILNISESKAILEILNKKIELLKEEKKMNLVHASKVPSELYTTRNALAFVFSPGEIAPLSEGEIEIHIPYQNLQSALTPNFTTILENSTGWWNYKPVK